MSLRSAAVVLAGLLACGCGADDDDDTGGDGGADAAPLPGTPVASWTLSGTITFPADEAAPNLKLVLADDINTHAATEYANEPALLVLAGSPPVASFSISIDTARIGAVTGPKILLLSIFQDSNANGIFDVGEGRRSVQPLDTTSGVFCRAGDCVTTPAFHHLLRGSTGAPVTGWYVDQCGAAACRLLITTSTRDLSGAKLTYYSGMPGAIQPR